MKIILLISHTSFLTLDKTFKWQLLLTPSCSSEQSGIAPMKPNDLKPQR